MVGRLFLTSGIALVLAGLGWFGATVVEVRSAGRTQGQIIKVDRDIGDTGAIYWPTFRFQDTSGRTFECRFSIGLEEDRFAVGDAVEVIYPKNDPARARVNDPLQLYLKPALMLGLGLVTLYFTRIGWRAAAEARGRYGVRDADPAG